MTNTNLKEFGALFAPTGVPAPCLDEQKEGGKDIAPIPCSIKNTILALALFIRANLPN